MYMHSISINMKEITDKGIEKVHRNNFLGVLSTMLIIGLCLFCGAWALEQIDHEPKQKIVDLPEEMQIVKGNELLFIERVTKDSIIIGFKH